jgi:hypothetical protein
MELAARARRASSKSAVAYIRGCWRVEARITAAGRLQFKVDGRVRSGFDVLSLAHVAYQKEAAQ